MKNKITGIVLVLGFATISVISFIHTGGEIGGGWGLLSFLTLIVWGWNET